MPNLYVALVHYPVINKNGETIASAITNLDLHDISRLAKTYGLRSFFVVTPLFDQQILANRIVSHWVTGAGATYNPNRREALGLIRIKNSIQDVVDHISDNGHQFIKTVATCARPRKDRLSFTEFRKKLKSGTPYLLIFGTAWGLAQEVISQADYVLNPIRGVAEYNHLSVRTAAAIVLDRLIGSDR